MIFTVRVSDPRIEHAYIQMGMARIEIDVYFSELFLLANQHPRRPNRYDHKCINLFDIITVKNICDAKTNYITFVSLLDFYGL